MSETTVDIDPQVAMQQHVERITGRIIERIDYGPITVTTRVPDLPGVRYFGPFASDTDRRPIGYISHSNLDISTDNGIQVRFIHPDIDEPMELPLEEISNVHVDHPHGGHMPLHGSGMMAVGISGRDTSSPVLRWPNHVIEYGWGQQHETFTHPDYPVVSVIRAYRADDPNPGSVKSTRPALEEAMQEDSNPYVFLISRAENEKVIVTSRIGFDEGSKVVVACPRHPEGVEEMDVNMIDCDKTVNDDELLERHLKRCASQTDGSECLPLTPFESDGVFLYMVSD